MPEDEPPKEGRRKFQHEVVGEEEPAETLNGAAFEFEQLFVVLEALKKCTTLICLVF